MSFWLDYSQISRPHRRRRLRGLISQIRHRESTASWQSSNTQRRPAGEGLAIATMCEALTMLALLRMPPTVVPQTGGETRLPPRGYSRAAEGERSPYRDEGRL